MTSILSSILFSRRQKSPIAALLSFALMVGMCGLILFGGIMEPSEKFADKPEILNKIEQYQINLEVPYLNQMSRMLMSTPISDPDYLKTSLFIPNKYKKDGKVENHESMKPPQKKKSIWKKFEKELFDRDFNEPGNLFIFALCIAIVVTLLHMLIFGCCWIKVRCC